MDTNNTTAGPAPYYSGLANPPLVTYPSPGNIAYVNAKPELPDLTPVVQELQKIQVTLEILLGTVIDELRELKKVVSEWPD